MKKSIIVFVLLALTATLFACGKSTAAYANYPGGCSVHGTVYTEFAASLVAYIPELGERFTLCRDPLCTHDGESVCPNSIDIFSVATNGEQIFINSRAMEKYGMTGVLYSLSPANGDMRVLIKYNITGGSIPDIYCDGKYIYYTESFYRNTNTLEDSYGVLMRVKCGGGQPSVAVEGEWSNEAELYADDTDYYVCDLDTLTVIERRTGKATEYKIPSAISNGIFLSDGAAYLLGTTEMERYKSENCVFLESRESLYRFADGSFTLIADGMSYPVVFGNSEIYYTPCLPTDEYELVGTKELPTGGGGNSAYDFIRRSDGTIVRVDLVGGEKQTWTLDSEYIKAELQACVDGTLFATVSDLRDLTTDYENCRLILNGDSTVSITESETNK